MNRRHLIKRLLSLLGGGATISAIGSSNHSLPVSSTIIGNTAILNPPQIFTLAYSFKTATNGKVYIGKIDTIPTIIQNQIQVFIQNEDDSFSPIAQPININAEGNLIHENQISKFVTVEEYSMEVYNAYNVQQFYFPNALRYDSLHFHLISSEYNGDVYTDGKDKSISNTLAYWATPELYGAVGDGVTDDTIPVTKAIMTGRCLMRRNATYRMIMTEDNVIIPPAGSTIDFNGASITHESMGHLVFLNKNSDVTILNFNGIYKGSYPSSVLPTNRYGIFRPHEAAFTGFIGMHGDAYRFKVIHSRITGHSTSNKYDFFITGFEGDFRGSVFKNIYGTHYSNLIANNFHRTIIEGVIGTLRHADSIAIYGPSHLMYVGIVNGTIRKVHEFGALLSNLSSGAEATIQITAGTNALIEDITTTMDNVGVIAYKTEGDGATFRNIESRSNFTLTKNSRLFEIQTNLQSTIWNTTIDNMKLFLPVGNIQASAFWCGGSKTNARNIYIDVPYTNLKRESEIALLVTSEYADIELDVRSSRTDSSILLSAFNSSKLKVNILNHPITYRSNKSILTGNWGECSGSKIETVDNLNAPNLNIISVNAATRLNCQFLLKGIVKGDLYGQVINQPTTTSITNKISINLQDIIHNLLLHNSLTYDIVIVCTSRSAAQILFAKYKLSILVNNNIISATPEIVTRQHIGTTRITSAITFNPINGDLAVTCTKQNGGENLQSLIVRARIIN